MEKNNLIYGLRDPRNDVYYYIGKTTIGKQRPLKHLTYSHNGNVRKWVNELTGLGLEPFIDIIEENLTLEVLDSKEKFWVNEFKKNNNDLLNVMLIKDDVTDVSPNLDMGQLEIIEKYLNNISDLVRAVRLKNNLRQDELAKICGVNRSTIVSIENGGDVKSSLLRTIINIGLKSVSIGNGKRKIRRKL
jgi:DNA-binding XRE family transcriptional regulator